MYWLEKVLVIYIKVIIVLIYDKLYLCDIRNNDVVL